jgi:circadian clock protein KaiC
MLQIVRSGGERNRTLTIIKSRGMAHSNQASEYRLSNRGVKIVDTYFGAGDVVTGSARLAKEADDAATLLAGAEEIARKQAERERRRKSLERQLVELREQFEAEDAVIKSDIQEATLRRERLSAGRMAMGESRRAFAPASKNGQSKRSKRSKQGGQDGRP